MAVMTVAPSPLARTDLLPFNAQAIRLVPLGGILVAMVELLPTSDWGGRD